LPIIEINKIWRFNMGNNKETVNDRVKMARKTLEMTQQSFAKSIRLKHGQISAIELNRCSVTEQNILLICTPNRIKPGKTVSEDWLRTGKGEMFTNSANGIRLFDDNGEELPPDEAELIGVYRELMPENQEYVLKNAKLVFVTQERIEQKLVYDENFGKSRIQPPSSVHGKKRA